MSWLPSYGILNRSMLASIRLYGNQPTNISEPMPSAGCADTCVRTWSTTSLQQVAEHRCNAGVPRCVRWAPRHLLLASACVGVALWVPTDLRQLGGPLPN